MTIVDSSSWIETLRPGGDPLVRSRVESLLNAGNAAWCSMIRLELWRGARAGAERKLLEFLESRLRLLEITEEIWESSVRLMMKARLSGLSAPPPDVLIAATAQFHRVRVEHCDHHLERLLNLV
jgi:predicted nucleic acid-binding protein